MATRGKGRKGAAFTVDNFVARSGAQPQTVRWYGEELRRLERRLGRPLGEASERALERLKSELRNERSGKYRCTLLRMYFNQAGRPDLAGIMRMKQRTRRLSPDEILTLPEINQLVAAATSLRDRALLVIMWESGSRISEVLSLDVSDVKEYVVPGNGGRQFLQVYFDTTKVRGTEHTSLLVEGVDHVLAWLRAYAPKRDDVPLFPSYKGARLSRDAVERMIARTAARAGLKKKPTPHTLRHSRATHLLRLGMTEPQVRVLLGWAAGSPLIGRYSHLVDRDAYTALLRAHGLRPPEEAAPGTLIAAEGELRPVLPLVAPPGSPRTETDRQAEMEAELTKLRALRFEYEEALARLGRETSLYGDKMTDEMAIRTALRPWTPSRPRKAEDSK